jgi:hypothetical protein
MLKSTILSFTCYLLLAPQAFFAQCTGIEANLVAPYANNSSNDGVMFDVSATNTVTIFCFDANLPASSVGDYAIYYKVGSYVGSENIESDWTLIGSATSVASNGSDVATSLSIPVDLAILTGQTFGFYITATNPIPSSTGLLTTTNAGYITISSNSDIDILGGVEITYPFSNTVLNKSLNGTVHYTSGNVLPVEFTDFTAVKINQSVLLEWETESENNSDYFEVERSANALDWNRLFKTPAAGESTEPRKYNELDLEPLEGISYYRLSQFDLDGTRTLLKSISFNNEIEIEANEIRVFPNPITERVRVFGEKTELENLKILNSIGQDICKDLTISCYNGYSEIYFNNQSQGIFILKTKTNSQILIKK